MSFQHIVTVLWVAILSVNAAWCLRLWGQGLATRYPLLLAFLLGEIVLDVAGYTLYRWAGPNSAAYFWFFLPSRVLSVTLLFLVILQVYQRLVDDYQAFRRIGQIVLYTCLGLATVVILGSTFLDPSGDSLFGFWILQERGMYLALTGLASGLLGFAYFFRLIPSRNVMTLFAVFGLMFITQALLWSVRNYWGPDFRTIQSLTSSGLIFCCLLAGTVMFSKAGEAAGYDDDYRDAAKRYGDDSHRRIKEINQALLDVFHL